MTGTAALSSAISTMAAAVRRVSMRSGRYADADARAALRDAALELLGALEVSTTQFGDGITVDTLLRGLRVLDVAELAHEERRELAESFAPVVAALRQSNEIGVRARELDATPAGASLGSLLADTNPTALDPDAQLSFIAACERQAAWIQSRQDAGLVAFAGSNPRDSVYHVRGDAHALVDARRTEIAAELHWSEATAHARLTAARTLAADLPDAAAAMADGLLSPRHARAICEGAVRLTASLDERIDLASKTHAPASVMQVLHEERQALLRDFSQRTVPYAEHHDLARTKSAINRAVAVIDPAGFAARRTRAARVEAGVRVDHAHDAMATITATLPGEQAMACMRAIDRLAKAPDFAHPSQPIGVRRSAAFVSLLTGPSTPTGRSSLRAHVDIVIDFMTLVGLNDNPAHVRGVGPLPASVVRELIASDPQATLRRMVTDPVTATPIDIGRRRYRIDAGLRELIEMRDGTCRFTDCGQPAHRCECDHAEPFAEGGSTTPANLGLACKRHHQCKTQGGWQIVDSDDDGSCTWRSPHGRHYAHEPVPLLAALEIPATPSANTESSRLWHITRRALSLHHGRTCSAAHVIEQCPRLTTTSALDDDPPPF